MKLNIARPTPLTRGTAYHLGVHSAGENFVGRYGNVLGVVGGMRQNDDSASDGASYEFGASDVVDVGLSVRAHYVSGGSPAHRSPERSSPRNVARPRVTGSAVVGGLLEVDSGSWSGRPAPRLSVTWQRCARNGSSCRNIAGATSTQYRVGAADARRVLRVVVTAANAVGSSSATSMRVRIARQPSPTPPTQLTPPRQAPGLAHLWLSPQNGTCRRSATPTSYDPARACASAAAAYNAANASTDSTLILVKGGDHSSFQISGRRTSTNRIVFDAAPGERPVFAGGWMSIGRPGETGGNPSYVTIRNLDTGARGAGETSENRYGVRVESGSHDIQLENLRAGGFLIQGAKHVKVIGGEYWTVPRVEVGSLDL